MRHNPVYSRILKIAAWLSVAVFVLIAVFIVSKSLPFLWQQGWTRIVSDDGWFPSLGSFNMLPMLYASLLIALATALFAGPIGVLIAVFLRYYSPPKLAKWFRAILDLLAGLPSVVYGFWGLLVLVPLINQWVPPGASVLAAILVLTLMVLPLIVLLVDSALHKTPLAWQQAADALAIQPWSYIYRVVLPSVRPAIVSGVILQVGRAMGETMAVLMVCGNIVQYPHNPFQPARTLTANIALEMGYATGSHSDALFVSALILMLASIVIVLLANRLQQKKASLYELR